MIVVIRKKKKVVVIPKKKEKKKKYPFPRGIEKGLYCSGDIGKDFPRHGGKKKVDSVRVFVDKNGKLNSLCDMCCIMKLYFNDGRKQRKRVKEASKKTLEKKRVCVILRKKKKIVVIKRRK